MTRSEFLRALEDENINSGIVKFDDSASDDVFCVRQNYHIWEVFYRERGEECDVRTFNIESHALIYLFNKLISYQKMKAKDK